MYEITNSTAKINGKNDNKQSNNVTNPSVKYGKNAVKNFYSYLEQPIMNDNNATPPILDFGGSAAAADKNIENMEKYVKANDEYLKAFPPLEYEYRYMPNIHKGNIDKDALMSAAYEEMGRRKEIKVQDIDDTFALSNDFSSKPLDINNDGKIDIGEYGTSILAADMLSKSNTADINNIDGTINNKGHLAVQEYAKKSNAQSAAELYKHLYEKYNLSDAAKKFNPNS